jgi:hypothetical protein
LWNRWWLIRHVARLINTKRIDRQGTTFHDSTAK